MCCKPKLADQFVPLQAKQQVTLPRHRAWFLRSSSSRHPAVSASTSTSILMASTFSGVSFEIIESIAPPPTREPRLVTSKDRDGHSLTAILQLMATTALPPLKTTPPFSH